MDIQEVKDIWEHVKNTLQADIPEHIFKTWISPLEAADFENNTLVLLSPQQLSVDILKKDWSDNIKKAVKSVAGENSSFSLQYDSDLAQTYIKKRKKELSKIVAGQTEDDRKEIDRKRSLAQMQSDANLNLNLKFENFVVGDNSKFAYKAALSVAKNPSKKFNPLFIYGASGLGKTHLLQAIGHYVLFNSKLKVRYLRMEEYFNEWVKCFQFADMNGKLKRTCNNSLMKKFHQKIRSSDILLIDDVQFIESRTRTMEDFFSTFEALYTSNKQIVIASDRLPKDIPTLDNRLRTRFEMGLVVDIVPPDYETRFEIVKAYAKELEAEAPAEVYEYVAKNFDNNVRELKGAYNKIAAFAEFYEKGIDMETAHQALKLEMKKNELTIDIIAQKTAQYFGLEVKDLKSTARQQKISHARHIAIYLARELLKMSYESIGVFFDKKHTTVMYSCDLISGKLDTDKDLAVQINAVKNLLKG